MWDKHCLLFASLQKALAQATLPSSFACGLFALRLSLTQRRIGEYPRRFGVWDSIHSPTCDDEESEAFFVSRLASACASHARFMSPYLLLHDTFPLGMGCCNSKKAVETPNDVNDPFGYTCSAKEVDGFHTDPYENTSYPRGNSFPPYVAQNQGGPYGHHTPQTPYEYSMPSTRPMSTDRTSGTASPFGSPFASLAPSPRAHPSLPQGVHIPRLDLSSVTAQNPRNQAAPCQPNVAAQRMWVVWGIVWVRGASRLTPRDVRLIMHNWSAFSLTKHCIGGARGRGRSRAMTIGMQQHHARSEEICGICSHPPKSA